jgi:hypothetical protein
MLDWVLNGVPVYIRKRPSDGKLYATTYDFGRFLKEPALATVRVRLAKDTPKDFKPEEHRSVLKKMRELECADMAQ